MTIKEDVIVEDTSEQEPIDEVRHASSNISICHGKLVPAENHLSAETAHGRDDSNSNSNVALRPSFSATPETASEGEEQTNESRRDDKEVDLETDSVAEQRWNLKLIRAFCGKIVSDARFQLLVVILILINGAMMGIATFSFVEKNPSIASVFATLDLAFLIIFTAELALQFIYHGLHLFTDGWLVFDFVIILMSWSLSSMQIVRTFRVFRALRLVTRIKVLKNLVSALFSVGPRMSAIFCLLLLIFYIYGVMCTVLFKDLYKDGHTEHDYFSRLDFTLWTLLVMMTLDWAYVARQVMAVIPYAWMIFVSFVMITSFIAYNLIIAVVCDSVSIIEQQGKEEENEEEAEAENNDAVHTGKIQELHRRIEALTRQQHQVLKVLQEAVERNTTGS